MNRLTSADHRNGSSGFTLIEFSIVLVLITILSALAVSTYGMMANKARMTQAMTVLNLLSKTEAAYFSDHKLYTDNLALLDFGPVKYDYYQVSVVLDNDAKNYKGTATGIGVMAGDSWTITKDGQPMHAANSSFR
jgi:prepilin-type N-terminal cleavage/methylation domain-containing protein